MILKLAWLNHKDVEPRKSVTPLTVREAKSKASTASTLLASPPTGVGTGSTDSYLPLHHNNTLLPSGELGQISVLVPRGENKSVLGLAGFDLWNERHTSKRALRLECRGQLVEPVSPHCARLPIGHFEQYRREVNLADTAQQLVHPSPILKPGRLRFLSTRSGNPETVRGPLKDRRFKVTL